MILKDIRYHSTTLCNRCFTVYLTDSHLTRVFILVVLVFKV